MEVSGSKGLNYDIEEKALNGSVFTMQEIALACRNAGRNPDLAGESLCDKQANTSTSSIHASTGEARGEESSKSSNSNISEKSFYANGKSKPPKTKWHPVSGGTVSNFLGKDYVKPAQPTNGTGLASKPLKLDPKEFPMSALWGEETKPKQSKGDDLQKEMEDFLFKMLGEGFQLSRDVIREVLDSCGYDMQKSMSKLIDHSAETLGEKTKFLGKSSEKCMDICSTFGGSQRERKLQQLNSSGGRAKEDPNTNKGELLRHPKDRNELQKEVFAALFSAPKKSDEFPEIMVKTERRSKALGKVVSGPPEDLVPEYKANVVHLQQDNQNIADNVEEDSFQHLRTAVMEYRGIMKEYCKAAIDAFAQGDHVQAEKLLGQGKFFYEKAREADEESNKKIFETSGRNRDTKNDLLLDLHDHGAKEAIRLLKCHLSSLSGIPTIKYLKVILEMNDEDTTKGGRRRRVMKLLEEESIEWTEEGNAGTILIPLDKVNPKTLSFTKK
ncbi:hypothetical protein CICLE_v10014995mg [Citrus x clementina]|uniref:DUF1771 domain-containing protein n=1 Tax=Citrus clementina TaxID=85681 RepID=V4UJS4_CITCL|nr:putative nuclear RNA export factor SDE5 [Citrus x clementina]ESR62566.1 hypothetical protein CICLE_v10014995mg [Citrus x clementina]